MNRQSTVNFKAFHPRGFSLVEVLLSVLILGIGLMMVAAVFPVGAKWTQQNAEETVGMTVGRNAEAIIRLKYTAADMTGINGSLVPMPGIGSKLTLQDRAYAFGSIPAYPAVDPARASYFWTALIRRSASDPTGRRFDVYVFVFRKGQGDLTYTQNPPGATLLAGVRGGGEAGVPSLAVGMASSVLAAAYEDFPLLSQGVAVESGMVFKKLADGPRPMLSAGDADIVFSPPADDTSASPLVTVFQTTLMFQE